MTCTENITIESEAKKKGRPQSVHYVKESELRDEIQTAKQVKAIALSKIHTTWDENISVATTETDKLLGLKQCQAAIYSAETVTYCNVRLCEIIRLTTNRVATLPKFRQYGFLEDMKAEAVYQAVRGIAKFDLDKLNKAGQAASAFSYLTQIITNAFWQIRKKEKKNKDIRDKVMTMTSDSDLNL